MSCSLQSKIDFLRFGEKIVLKFFCLRLESKDLWSFIDECSLKVFYIPLDKKRPKFYNRVTHKGGDCKDDLKFLKYEDNNVNHGDLKIVL